MVRNILKTEREALHQKKDTPDEMHFLLTWPQDICFEVQVEDNTLNFQSLINLRPCSGMHIKVLDGVHGAVHELSSGHIVLLNWQMEQKQIHACIEIQMINPPVLALTGESGLVDGDRGLGSLQKLVRMAYFKMDSGDCAEVLARHFGDGDSTLPNVERVCFDFSDSDYSDEVWPVFELVLSNITRSNHGPVKHFTIEVDAGGMLYDAFGEPAFEDDCDMQVVRKRLHQTRTAEGLIFSDGRTGPLQVGKEGTARQLDIGIRSRGKCRVMTLAVYLAARCQQQANVRPGEGRHLLRLAGEFETYADGLLDMCRTKHEAERILQSNRRVLASTCIVDYIIHHNLRKLAGNRWIQTYLKDVWQSASLIRSMPQATVLHKAEPCWYKAAVKNDQGRSGDEAHSHLASSLVTTLEYDLDTETLDELLTGGPSHILTRVDMQTAEQTRKDKFSLKFSNCKSHAQGESAQKRAHNASSFGSTGEIAMQLPVVIVKAVLGSLALCFLIPLMLCFGTRRGNIASTGSEKVGYRIWKRSRWIYLDWIVRPFSVPKVLYCCWCCTHIMFCYALINMATGSWVGPFDTSRSRKTRKSANPPCPCLQFECSC